MWNIILKLKLYYIIGIFGILLVFLSMFDITDFSKLQFSYYADTRFLPFFIGCIFCAIAVMMSILESPDLFLLGSAKSQVKKTKSGYEITIGTAKIEICFGKIRDFLLNEEKNTAIALPANNLFDDDCINDTRSALGSFVNYYFPNQVHNICKLAEEFKQTVDGSFENGIKRFPIGSVLFFDQPINKNIKMIFLAVTKVTNNEGIHCEAANIFQAVKGLHKTMNIKRLDQVVLPVIGSGHGCIRPHVSFLCMLIAFAEVLSERTGQHIKLVRVVVHQKDTFSKPSISAMDVKKSLSFILRYC